MKKKTYIAFKDGEEQSRYSTLIAAANDMVKRQLSKSVQGARAGIGKSIRNKNTPAYGFYWEVIEE